MSKNFRSNWRIVIAILTTSRNAYGSMVAIKSAFKKHAPKVPPSISLILILRTKLYAEATNNTKHTQHKYHDMNIVYIYYRLIVFLSSYSYDYSQETYT